MKAKLFRAAGAVLGISALLFSSGCTTPTGEPNYTGTGALVGGVSGAGLGSLLARRNPAAGAVLGGAAGLITGGLIGNSMDQEEARPPLYVAAPPPAPLAEPVPPSPGPGYVWVRGQWLWNGTAWAWAAGRWVPSQPPQPAWVPAQWVRGPYGWYWQPGHWQ